MNNSGRTMSLNKELYRQAYQQYQQVNEWEVRERLGKRKHLSPLEAWRQYVDVVEFCWLFCPSQSQRQRTEKLMALNRYYERVQTLEAWRRQHGKTS